MFENPVVFDCNEVVPIEVLLDPVVFNCNDAAPTAVFEKPVVFVCNVNDPIAVFESPVVFNCNVFDPNPVLKLLLLFCIDENPKHVLLLVVTFVFVFSPALVLFVENMFIPYPCGPVRP